MTTQVTPTEQIKQQALVKKQKSRSIPELIKLSLNELGKALPAHLNAERLGRIALTTMRLNPALAECTPESFLGALFQSAQLGLEPNVEGQAYLIPYTNSKKVGNEWIKVKEVQFQIGYKGYIELFYRHELSCTLDMHRVFSNDEFDYSYGTDSFLKHKPCVNGDRGDVIGYYAVAKLRNGSIFKYMTKTECIEHGQTHSKSFDKVKKEFDKNSPWSKEPDAMCKKTVLIQLMKLLPKSVEIQKALAMDNTTKSKVNIDMFNIKDETNWNDEEIIEVTEVNERKAA